MKGHVKVYEESPTCQALPASAPDREVVLARNDLLKLDTVTVAEVCTMKVPEVNVHAFFGVA